MHRLEKTVEGLSHGLITALTALTELKDIRGHTTSSSTVDALSAALSGLSTEVGQPGSTSEASTPGATNGPSEQPDPSTQRDNASQHTTAKLGTPSGSGESKFDPTVEPDRDDNDATENRSSLSLRDDRSPISGLLKPILDFMTCPEVFQFLKRAEAHPGLRSTQLFNLFWVSDNFFNVHGGVLMYCLQKSFIPMDAISGATGSSAWSEDLELMQELDETYMEHLRPHLNTYGSRSSVPKAAWESYCLELSDTFSKCLPDWGSAASFFKNLSGEYDRQVPMITSSYVEDLSSLWTEVHPALLEVARWLEPFIDYGPDYHRATPLYDATIALGRHACKLYSQQGGTQEPTTLSDNLMQLLCEHQSGDLRTMQREMDSVMSGAVPGTTVAALVDRAKRVTLWHAADTREAEMQDAQARREVRAMMGYRPNLLRKGTAAARIRKAVLEVLVQTAPGWAVECGLIGEREMFWDVL